MPNIFSMAKQNFWQSQKYEKTYFNDKDIGKH